MVLLNLLYPSLLSGGSALVASQAAEDAQGAGLYMQCKSTLASSETILYIAPAKCIFTPYLMQFGVRSKRALVQYFG